MEFNKQQNREEDAEQLRRLAFFGVVATVLCILSVPLAYQHFQRVGTQMQDELEFCKHRSGNILRELTRTQTLAQMFGGVKARAGGVKVRTARHLVYGEHLDCQDHRVQLECPDLTECREFLDSPDKMLKEAAVAVDPLLEAVASANPRNPVCLVRPDYQERTELRAFPARMEARERTDLLAHLDPTVNLVRLDNPVCPECLAPSQDTAQPSSDLLVLRGLMAPRVPLDSQDCQGLLDSSENRDCSATWARPVPPEIRDRMVNPAWLAKLGTSAVVTTVHSRAPRQAIERKKLRSIGLSLPLGADKISQKIFLSGGHKCHSNQYGSMVEWLCSQFAPSRFGSLPRGVRVVKEHSRGIPRWRVEQPLTDTWPGS
uniref:Col_cuticle_N domain-containing protein n=1 Tax=Globodera pallida TaxID=36090 RepID=A0A183CNZ6_GLOPA